jgi:hypothetical protein
MHVGKIFFSAKINKEAIKKPQQRPLVVASECFPSNSDKKKKVKLSP